MLASKGRRANESKCAIVVRVLKVEAMRVWPVPLWVRVRDMEMGLKLGSVSVGRARGWVEKCSSSDGGMAEGVSVWGLRLAGILEDW